MQVGGKKSTARGLSHCLVLRRRPFFYSKLHTPGGRVKSQLRSLERSNVGITPVLSDSTDAQASQTLLTFQSQPRSTTKGFADA